MSVSNSNLVKLLFFNQSAVSGATPNSNRAHFFPFSSKKMSSLPAAPADSLAPPMASYAKEVATESSAYKPTNGLDSTSSIHAFSQAEKMAFVKHINAALSTQSALKDRLPLDPESNDIFGAVRDGILLW
jgi:hypothetical protein